MESGISDVVQVIKVELELAKMGGRALCVAVRAGKEALETARRLALLFANLVNFILNDRKYLKKYGKTNLDNLLAKTNDKGGFTALRFDSKEQMEDFIKKAGKTVLSAPIPSMDSRDGACFLGVANTDLDMAKEVLNECMRDWAAAAVRNGISVDAAEAGKALAETNRETSWTEYMNENGFLDMPMETYENRLAEQFGDGCICCEDLKKNPDERAAALEVEETAVAVRKGELAAQSSDSVKFVTIELDRDDMLVFGKDSCSIVDRTNSREAFEVPFSQIYVKGNQILAVVPKDMDLELYSTENREAGRQGPETARPEPVKAGPFLLGYQDRLRMQREEMLKDRRKKPEAGRQGPETVRPGPVKIQAAQKGAPVRGKKA